MPEDTINIVNDYEVKLTKCQPCNGRGGWEDGDEGQSVTHKDCNGSGKIPAMQQCYDLHAKVLDDLEDLKTTMHNFFHKVIAQEINAETALAILNLVNDRINIAANYVSTRKYISQL